MKELDTVFPDFEVELLDCPKGCLSEQKGQTWDVTFSRGYYSFDDKVEMDDCHFYVQYFR